MSTSVASVVSHFPSAENGFTTTTSGSVSSGATSVGLNSVAGYANGEIAVFVIDPSNASKQTFTGVIDTSGVQVTSVVWTAGTNTTHASGATVVDYATATHVSMMTKGLLVEHNQSGTHSSITASGTLAVTGATTLTGALTVKSYDGWIAVPDTWTYVSATTFKITGSDVTAKFPVGTKLKLTQTTAKYFYVTAASFSSDTTVTVTGGTDYTLANAAITSPNLSYDATPQGFPQYFTFAPGFTNWTIGTGGSAGNIAEFALIGKTVFVRLKSILGTSGQSVSGEPTFNLPVTASANHANFDSPNRVWMLAGGAGFSGYVRLNSTTAAKIVPMVASGTYVSDGTVSSTTPATWAAGEYFTTSFNYEAA